MLKFIKRQPLLIVVLLGFGGVGCSEQQGDPALAPVEASASQSATHFSVSGDVNVSVDDATATLTKIRGMIPAMTILSTPASIKKNGKSYSVNLFFSDGFEPKPGTYPVAFSYRKKTATLGGSFLNGGRIFSMDTKGTAQIIEYGDEIKVRFEFEVFNESEGDEDRKGVTIKGEAVAAMADIFGEGI